MIQNRKILCYINNNKIDRKIKKHVKNISYISHKTLVVDNNPVPYVCYLCYGVTGNFYAIFRNQQ